MDNPRTDITLGAVSGIIGVALLVPTYQEGARVFLLPGDISPYFTPKLFVFAWIALSLAILIKGAVGMRRWSGTAAEHRWFAILGTFATTLAATALMTPVGFLIVAPVAVFVSVLLLGYRNHLLNVAVAVIVSVSLYLMLGQLAGLTLPRAFWQS